MAGASESAFGFSIPCQTRARRLLRKSCGSRHTLTGGATRSGVFYRVSETRRSYPDMNITKSNLHSLDVILEVHGLESIRSEVEEAYAGHHQYYWVRPRRTWLDSPCPVFIDLGGDLLAKLESYDDYGLPCVRLVTGSRLVEDAMSCAFAGSVGVS